jgi:hypothetical protein
MTDGGHYEPSIPVDQAVLDKRKHDPESKGTEGGPREHRYDEEGLAEWASDTDLGPVSYCIGPRVGRCQTAPRAPQRALRIQ